MAPRFPRHQTRGALLLATAVAVGALVAPGPGIHAPAAAASEGGRPSPPSQWREGFDDLELTSRPGPGGWDVQNDVSLAEGGADQWRGWSLTDRDSWSAAADQMRSRFSRAQDVLAVADSGQYDDGSAPAHSFDTTLVSPSVRVYRQDQLTLGFDTHYRQSAGQQATVTVEFDGSGEEVELLTYDDESVTEGYDGRLVNAHEDLDVQVPPGARRAVFRWRFVAEPGSWYWAVDNVRLRKTQPPVTGDPTSLWVVSDIQGHPHDLSHGLADLHAVRPDASGLLMVGDMVNTGAPEEWDEIDDVMADRADIRPPQTIAAIGNHERYAAGGWAANRQRFLDFAGREQVWGEYVLGGGSGVEVPVLVLGQDAATPPDVPISDEQMAWFRQRLAHWTEQERQVVVATHFPLGDTVSASWIPWYSNHHQRNDELTELLGDHPNVVLLSGHTHYPLELGDWAVQHRTAGGHPDGLWAVNTGAMHVEWDARGEDTDQITEVVTRDINRGLTIDAYDDRLVIQAHDFGVAGPDGDNQVNEVIREVEIPNPYLPRRYWR